MNPDDPVIDIMPLQVSVGCEALDPRMKSMRFIITSKGRQVQINDGKKSLILGRNMALKLADALRDAIDVIDRSEGLPMAPPVIEFENDETSCISGLRFSETVLRS